MDFSPWDRTKIFQLHEAACLIAGVMPSSKRVPAREELPSHALQYYKLLATAYVLWVMHDDQHDDPNYPKAEMLRGEPQIGSDEPTIAVSIDKLPGEFVSRDEVRRWIAATGIKSAYSFAPFVRAVGGAKTQPADPERRLARLRELGGSATYRHGEWKFTGIAGLVVSEKAECRKRSDEQTIRKDLREAAEAEREAKRARPWQGLEG